MIRAHHSDAAVTVHLDLGSRIPNADTAIGRALITALPRGRAPRRAVVQTPDRLAF